MLHLIDIIQHNIGGRIVLNNYVKIMKIRDFLCLVIQSLIAAALFFLTAANIYQVAARYAFGATQLWVEDVSVLIMLWMAGLGIGWLWMKHEHLNMDVASFILKKNVIKVFDVVLEIAGLFFGSLLAYYGAVGVRVNTGFSMSILGFDENMRYIPIFVAGLMIVIGSIFRLIEIVESRKNKEIGNI